MQSSMKAWQRQRLAIVASRATAAWLPGGFAQRKLSLQLRQLAAQCGENKLAAAIAGITSAGRAWHLNGGRRSGSAWWQLTSHRGGGMAHQDISAASAPSKWRFRRGTAAVAAWRQPSIKRQQRNHESLKRRGVKKRHHGENDQRRRSGIWRRNEKS